MFTEAFQYAYSLSDIGTESLTEVLSSNFTQTTAFTFTQMTFGLYESISPLVTGE